MKFLESRPKFGVPSTDCEAQTSEVGVLVDNLVPLHVNGLVMLVDLGQSSNDANGLAALPEGMGSDDLNQISETGSQSI